MRPVVKHLAETLLSATGLNQFALLAHRRRTLVLAYHNVVPEEERPCGDRSLHIPQRAFAAQLDAVLATHDVIPIGAVDDEPRGRRPRVVITFDDAYRGALTAGLVELKLRDLSAVVFVAPGLLGTTTWWDRLADSGTGALDPELRAAALAAHAGRAERILAAFGAGTMTLPSWAAIATEEEVRAVAARPDITWGAHGWDHVNLTALGPAELARELERPLAWLRSLAQTGRTWLAYPYGLSSPAVVQAAMAAGYDGAFRNHGGWLPADVSLPAVRYDLPRVNVSSGLSRAGFRFRAAGLLSRW